MYKTPIQFLDSEYENNIYIKRDDLIPYSFGGNKARKAFLFFKDIDSGGYDCVVTYGSSHSNHCRVISNMAVARNIQCYLIAPEEVSEPTYNSNLMNLFGAKITTVPVGKVQDSIKMKLKELNENGNKPYFIPGGGHGKLGTAAYVECYSEIKEYELDHNLEFDYIFLASGTGTTHAGLICGQINNKDTKKIIGISIARKNPRGRNIIIDCIKEYIPQIEEQVIQERTIFVDEYIGAGYGKATDDIENEVKLVMIKYGIPLDTTYTGKAFLGMKKYIKKEGIMNKNILFIHTGGTPLFFDGLRRV